ncbi:MAG: hypothetical protein R3A11_08245 [Bdellovibrionota bacterium]
MDSQFPLDVVIIYLGCNDCKADSDRFIAHPKRPKMLFRLIPIKNRQKSTLIFPLTTGAHRR